MRWLYLFLITGLGFGQTANWFDFDPPVAAPGATSVVLLSSISGTPTRVTLQPAWDATIDLDLRDDGVPPDKVAGDKVYTLNVPLAKLAVTPDDVFRPFLGFLKLWNGTTVVIRYNLFLSIAAPDIPRMPITEDGPGMRHTAYVVNIVAPEAFPTAQNPALLPSFTTVTQKFYQHFGDDYDVLNVAWISPSFFQNRDHAVVKNTVQGIGLPPIDNSSSYSSKGTLFGITRLPNNSFIDGAETGWQHEFGHQWINSLKLPLVSSASPHWPISTMATHIMGISIPPTNEGGQFPCTMIQEAGGIRLAPNPLAPVFGDLDLYLMGLTPPDQVGTNLVISDPTQANFVATHCDGRLYTGPFETLTVQNVISVSGSRVPSAANSKKHFRIATILMTRDKPLDDNAMAFFSYFVRRAEEKGEVPSHFGLVKNSAKPFAITTQGLADWSMQLTPVSLPEINYGGVVNGASGGSFISPGSYASAYGTLLAATVLPAPSTPLPPGLGGTTVMVNGKPAPLYYVNPLQVNFQVPFSTAVGLTTVSISVNGAPSSIAWVQTKPAAPGILTYGNNRAVAQNLPGSTLNGPDNPVAPGSYITVYMTGIGPLDNTPWDGAAASGSPLSKATLAHSARLGGSAATIDFLGLAPGFVGLGQANVLVPNLSPGDYPLVITVGGVDSNGPLVAVGNQ